MARFTKWAGLALGLGLCVYFLARMDWPAFFSHVLMIRPLPVAGMLAAIILSTVGRAVRWRLLAGKADNGSQGRTGTGLATFWRAVILGYLGNYIYPARAGEMLRIVYLQRATRLPAAHVLTSSLIDRMLDVLVVAGCAMYLAWRGLFVAESPRALPYLAGGIVVGLLVLVLVVRHHAALRMAMSRLSAMHGPPGRDRFARWTGQALDAVLPLRSPGVLGTSLACTAGVIALDALAIWMLLTAFAWSLPLSAGLTLYVFLTLGAVLPAAPGYLGVYQAVSVLVLGMYGIPETGALACAFTLQGLSLSLFLLLALAGWAPGRLRGGTTGGRGGEAANRNQRGMEDHGG